MKRIGLRARLLIVVLVLVAVAGMAQAALPDDRPPHADEAMEPLAPGTLTWLCPERSPSGIPMPANGYIEVRYVTPDPDDPRDDVLHVRWPQTGDEERRTRASLEAERCRGNERPQAVPCVVLAGASMRYRSGQTNLLPEGLAVSRNFTRGNESHVTLPGGLPVTMRSANLRCAPYPVEIDDGTRRGAEIRVCTDLLGVHVFGSPLIAGRIDAGRTVVVASRSSRRDGTVDVTVEVADGRILVAGHMQDVSVTVTAHALLAAAAACPGG